jgi:hypothetical protein
MRMNAFVGMTAALLFANTSMQAATLDWDNGGADTLLSTANNWNPNQTPAASDILNIATGDTVSHANNLPGTVTVNLSGNSALSTDGGVIRLNNAIIDVASGCSLIGAFWDLNNGDLTFDSGAICTVANWEQKGNNTFTFNLGAAGFTTMTPGAFRLGGGATIANATYTADLASYTGGGGIITLVDFGSDAVGMNNATFQGAGGLNVINAGANTARFYWDDATEAITLNVNPTVIWDAGAGDGLWTSANNWTGGPDNQAPVANDTVVISSGDTVTSIVNSMPGNVTVNLTGNSTLTRPSSVIRLNNATINVGSGSGLTGAGFWDLDDADITFDNGAVVTMGNWEQKDVNTFTFNLGAAGFSTLMPGTFRIGGGSLSADIANATYTVDMAAYTGGTGTVTLVDFAADAVGMNNATFQGAGGLNVINSGAYSGSYLAWDDATESIVLNIMPPTWDGDDGDGLWNTALNWSADAVPLAGEIALIANGDTVSHANNLPGAVTVNLSGNSVLSTDGAVIRLNNANINVASGSSLIGAFWDMNNGDLTFDDGAIATMANWENKGNNTFTFNLGAAGFSTLTPDGFLIGGGATIANAIYTVDMAAYTGGTGTVTLVDYTTDFASMDNATFQGAGGLNVINSGANSGSFLAWDDATESIVLNIMPPTWDGDAGDGLWTTALNWSGDAVPVAGETVIIANGDIVEWNLNGNLPAGLTIDVSGNSTLHSSSVLRLNSATINVASGSALTSDVNDWFDLAGGSVCFEDGSINTVYFWEHRNSNTFTFKLGATGFTTLNPINFRIAGGGTTIANATYIVDMANYTGVPGTIDLMDFVANASGVTAASFQTATLSVINAGANTGSTIVFDDVNHIVQLSIPFPAPTVVMFR